VAAASSILRYAESRLYADRILYTEQTPYQRIVLTVGEQTGRIRLYLDGHLQFAEMDEYRYHEALVHPLLSLPGRRARVLILGGGDGLAAREVLGYEDVERIDLVDIDPAMTKLCSTFPAIRALNGGALDDERVTLHHVDAFAFLRGEGPRFDRIVVDLPDPHNEALAKLYSVEFYRLLGRRLEEGGFFVTQSTSPWLTRETFWSVAETIRAAGMRVRSYGITVPSFGVWGFQLGAAADRVPERFPIPEERTRFLTAAVMEGAVRFAKDTAEVEGTVNSIFEPGIYLKYLEEVNR